MTIPVKPYVKVFVEFNYGSPASFVTDPTLQKELRGILKKQMKQNEKRCREQLSRYPEEIDIIISEDDFSRYGWAVAKTGVISFGRHLEEKAKLLMRTYIGVWTCFKSKKMAIHQFQEKFGFDEDTWSYESIKKDYDRHANCQFNLISDFSKKINELILGNLSDLGTISCKAKKEYEEVE